MCAVSFVSDHYWKKWPLPSEKWPWKTPLPYTITKEQWEEYQELKRRAYEYDVKTKQPDCVKPELIDWEQKMDEYLKKKGVIK